MVVHKVQLEAALQQQSVKITFFVIEPWSLQSYQPNDTEEYASLRAVFNWAIIITEVLRSSAVQHARDSSVCFTEIT